MECRAPSASASLPATGPLGLKAPSPPSPDDGDDNQGVPEAGAIPPKWVRGFRCAAGPLAHVSLLISLLSSPPPYLLTSVDLSSYRRKEHGVASVASPSPQPSFAKEGPAHSAGGGFQTGAPLLIEEAASDRLAGQGANESAARGTSREGGGAFLHSPRVTTDLSGLI